MKIELDEKEIELLQDLLEWKIRLNSRRIEYEPIDRMLGISREQSMINIEKEKEYQKERAVFLNNLIQKLKK